MELLESILSLVFALAGVLLVLYLSYVFSKYIAKKMNGVSRSNNIKIIEKIALGQDKCLIIAEICNKNYLLSVTNQNIQILKELDGVVLQNMQTSEPNNFMTMLNVAIKNKTFTKAGDKNENSNFKEHEN